jgi:hypothetical protein
MAAYTKSIGGSTITSFVGYSGDTFRSAIALSTTTENVNGAVGASNKPILVTFLREVFPTNSGTSARLEIDTASTGTASYASSYRNCSGDEDVVPNYKTNSGNTIWAGFRTNSSATLEFYLGGSGSVIRYKASTAETSTWDANDSLNLRVDWYGVPAAPSSLTASSVTNSSVTLSWTKNSDMGGYNLLTGYRILYKRTVDSSWSSTGKFGDNATTSATVSGLLTGTSYDFLVAATNAATDVYNPDYSLSSATVGTNASLTTSTLTGGVRNATNAWVAPITKVWNGSSWVTGNINVWTGTEWRRQ